MGLFASNKRPDLLDGFLTVLLTLFCGYLVGRLTPSIGLLTALAIVLTAIVFAFWFMSGKPAASLLKSHLPVAAFWWVATYIGIHWLHFTPKIINAGLPFLLLSQLAELPTPSSAQITINTSDATNQCRRRADN